MRVKRKTIAVVIALAASFQMDAIGGSFYVDVGNGAASDANPGTEALPFKTIQAAVEAAEANDSGYSFDSGDVIWVKPGRYDQGGYVDGNGLTNRVRITKKLYLRATGGRSNTFIVGAYDPTGTRNCGPAAVRCVDASASGVAGTIIRGFTITEGAVLSGNSGDAAAMAYAGGVYAYSTDVWIVECTISKCRAGRYAALYNGTSVRSLVTLNAANYVWGACSRYARYLNCVIFANGSMASAIYESYVPVENGSLVNCSLIDNVKNGVDGATTYNTIIASSSGADNDYKLPTTCSNLVWTAQHGNRQVMSTATGDFRLLSTSAAVNAGDPALLTKITLPSAISDLQYVDYLGNDIPQTGTINCGAVQEVATPVCGSIQCDFAAVSDGVEYTLKGAYAYFDTYPTQIVVKPVLSSSQSLYCLRHEPRLNNIDGLYPDMQNRIALMPDPNTGTNDVYASFMAGTTCWVATNGNDSASGTESNPLRTIQAAVDKVASTTRGKIFVKEGVYDGGTDSSGKYRFAMPSVRYCFVLAVDGPEKTVIRGGVGVGCCSMPYHGALQGFTLAGADTSATPSATSAFAGGKWLSTLLDCIIANNIAGESGAVCNGGTMQRCVIASNTGGSLCVNERLSSCAAYGNTASAMLFDASCSLYQCTVAGNTGSHFSGSAIINSVLDGGGAADFGSAAASSVGNVAHGFTSLPASGFLDADPIVVDASHGDLRTAIGSPSEKCGEPPTSSNYAGVYKQGWTVLSTTGLDNQKIRFAGGGIPEAGACQYDHPAVVDVLVSQGGISVVGDISEGRTVLREGESCTFTLTRNRNSPRYCTGFTANGEFVSFDDWPGGWTTTVSASSGSLSIVPVYATWLYAAPNGNDGNDGFTPDMPKTLLGALASVESGETVRALAGSYADGKRKVAEGDAIWCRAVVPDGVTLESVGGPEETFIIGEPAPAETPWQRNGCGTNAVRCVRILGSGRVRGFTLTGGHTVRLNGGGSDADKYGAAAYAADANAYVENCIVSNNVAVRGACARATFVGCRILENSADELAPGGYFGVYCNCLFDHNRGVDTCEYPSSLVNCTFGADNLNAGGTGRVTEIWCPGSSYKVRNCLFLGSMGGSKSGELSNCVAIKGNANVPDFLNYGYGAVDCVATNLAALSLASNGLVPTAASVCIVDRGSTSDYDACAVGASDKEVDAAGRPRVLNGAVDIGCYEFDWRGIYADDLGAKTRVLSATRSVVETSENSVRLLDGGSIVVGWRGGTGGAVPRIFPFTVVDGTVTVKLNGETAATLVADGNWRYDGGSADDVVEFSFAAAAPGGHVDLRKASALTGISIIVY